LPTSQGRSGTAAQRAGKRYESKALKHLRGVLGDAFVPSPWFRYINGKDAVRWCQPDGILRIEDFVAIFEIKIRFMGAAWWQLRRLYEPVVRRAFFAKQVGVFIVCGSLDPSETFPEEYALLDSLSGQALREWPVERTGVVLWRP
jgi:hypothetical protein